ncbi:hypothetical protein [Novosphingobium sp.]|uniref:hypothetical protein n=1 Tax=Novosphingobium sp. TaxID=1874826 RepID=UPI0026290FFC|nr:hypothetical protein [Novosphingobium sp.]
MNYRERLLSRAAAVPRSGGEALFDPFAQVAAWLPEEAPPVAARPPAAVAFPLEHRTAVRADEPMAQLSDPPASPLRPSLPVSLLPESATPRAPAVAPDAPAATQAAAAQSVASPDPLAMADAFFNQIAPRITRSPAHTAGPDMPTTQPAQAGQQAAPANAPTMRVTPLAPPAPPAPQQPARALVPPKPPAAPLPRAPSAAAARPASVAEPKAHPLKDEAARKPAPSPIETAGTARVVAVASAAAPRSDLAHSLGILRFGIGQG